MKIALVGKIFFTFLFPFFFDTWINPTTQASGTQVHTRSLSGHNSFDSWTSALRAVEVEEKNFHNFIYFLQIFISFENFTICQTLKNSKIISKLKKAFCVHSRYSRCFKTYFWRGGEGRRKTSFEPSTKPQKSHFSLFIPPCLQKLPRPTRRKLAGRHVMLGSHHVVFLESESWFVPFCVVVFLWPLCPSANSEQHSHCSKRIRYSMSQQGKRQCSWVRG